MKTKTTKTVCLISFGVKSSIRSLSLLREEERGKTQRHSANVSFSFKIQANAHRRRRCVRGRGKKKKAQQTYDTPTTLSTARAHRQFSEISPTCTVHQKSRCFNPSFAFLFCLIYFIFFFSLQFFFFFFCFGVFLAFCGPPHL